MEANIKDCKEVASNDVEGVQASNDLGGIGQATGGFLHGLLSPSVLSGTSTGANYSGEAQVAPNPRILTRIFQRISMFFTQPVLESSYKYNFISRIITTYEDRYWSIIKVNENGQVYFKLFRGWWGGRLLYKCGIRMGTKLHWDSVPPRDELASTLGVTHLQIEFMIKRDTVRRASIKNIKLLCTTDPDNLKMIAELDKLDKGTQVDDTKQDVGAMMLPAFTVAGSGTYSSGS